MRSIAVPVSVLIPFLAAAIPTTSARAQPQPLGDEQVIDRAVAFFACPAIATAGDGSGLMAWARETSPWEAQVVARQLGVDGALAPTRLIAGRRHGGYFDAPDVATVASGSVVVWVDSGAVSQPPLPLVSYPRRATSLDEQGVPRRTQRLGSPGSLVSPRPGGGFVVVERLEQRHALAMQLLDAGGRPLAARREIVRTVPYSAPYPQRVLHLPDGGFIVAWFLAEHHGFILAEWAQRFDAAGRQRRLFRLLAAPEHDIGWSARHLALGADGRLAVLALDGDVTTLRLFDRDGALLGGPVVVDEGAIVPLAVGVAPHGVLVLTTDGDPSTATSVYGRLFDLVASPLSPWFHVSVPTSEPQSFGCASVAWAIDHWVAVWGRSAAPFSSAELVAQRLSP